MMSVRVVWESFLHDGRTHVIARILPRSGRPQAQALWSISKQVLPPTHGGLCRALRELLTQVELQMNNIRRVYADRSDDVSSRER